MLPDLTVRTGHSAVDIVPFLRRLDGDMDAEFPDWERDDGIRALTAMGVPTWRLCKALNMSGESVADVLAGKPQREKRLPMTAEERRDKSNADRHRRFAQRVLIDGRLVHPYAGQHGTNSTYVGSGCRCVPCCEAHSAARRKSYPSKVAA
jgi:hypothetical protein